jgi:hypothetical protein
VKDIWFFAGTKKRGSMKWRNISPMEANGIFHTGIA